MFKFNFFQSVAAYSFSSKSSPILRSELNGLVYINQDNEKVSYRISKITPNIIEFDNRSRLYGNFIHDGGKPYSPGHSNLETSLRDKENINSGFLNSSKGTAMSYKVLEEWNDDYGMYWKLDAKILGRTVVNLSGVNFEAVKVQVLGESIESTMSSSWAEEGIKFKETILIDPRLKVILMLDRVWESTTSNSPPEVQKLTLKEFQLKNGSIVSLKSISGSGVKKTQVVDSSAAVSSISKLEAEKRKFEKRKRLDAEEKEKLKAEIQRLKLEAEKRILVERRRAQEEAKRRNEEIARSKARVERGKERKTARLKVLAEKKHYRAKQKSDRANPSAPLSEADQKKKIKNYNRAAALRINSLQPKPEFLVKGMRAYRAKNFKLAAKLFSKGFSAANAVSSYALAQMILSGKGKARELISKGRLRGVPKCRVALIVLKKALRWKNTYSKLSLLMGKIYAGENIKRWGNCKSKRWVLDYYQKAYFHAKDKEKHLGVMAEAAHRYADFLVLNYKMTIKRYKWVQTWYTAAFTHREYLPTGKQKYVQSQLVKIGPYIKKMEAKEKQKAVAKRKAKKKQQNLAKRNAEIRARMLKNDEKDTFQQVVNYLASSDPLIRSNGTYEGKIFDRKKCIAGFAFKSGGHLKIFWDNIDIKSIKIDWIFRANVWRYYVIFTGLPYAVEFQPNNTILQLMYRDMGLGIGRSSSVQLPIGGNPPYSLRRIKKSIEHLYKKHCKGSKRKTAF